MCRSIKVLRRPGQPATSEELHGAALQFVRKISGFHKPSRANQEAFDRAVLEIADSGRRLLDTIGLPPLRQPAISGERSGPAPPTGLQYLHDSEDNDGHVIVLFGACGESVSRLHNLGNGLLRRQTTRRLNGSNQVIFAPFFVGSVHSLGNPICKRYHEIALLQSDHCMLVGRLPG
jgi:hypothetical protein